MGQFWDVIGGFTEINIADFEKFFMLKVGEFVRVSTLLVLEAEKGLFL